MNKIPQAWTTVCPSCLAMTHCFFVQTETCPGSKQNINDINFMLWVDIGYKIVTSAESVLRIDRTCCQLRNPKKENQ